MKKIWPILLLMVAAEANAQEIDIEKLPKAKKFDWSGSIGATTSFYHTSGSEPHGNPFNWNINGNVNIKLMEALDLPFSFTVGKYQSSFTKPYLQFGITPTYKWAKLHLGHRNLNFNPYTLAGHTFLGAGVELNPKKFRFTAMYGRLRPAVEIDTTTNTVVIPSFRRKGYGLKIGYGDEKNYMDLMYFRAKDDPNSIQNWQDPEIKEKQGDANALLPVENNVLGVSAKATLAKHLVIAVEGGLSFYNPNTSDIEADQQADDIDLSKKLKWAGKSSMGYSFSGQEIKFEYERILPGYITLGSYFFNTDIENITLTPSGTLSKGKLTYMISAGLQKNNLDKTKTETTKRFITNANVSVNPAPECGVDMNYNNFAINQVPGTLPLNDSVRIRQINQTIAITPRFTIVKDTSATHNFSLSTTYNDVNDRNIVTKQYGNMKAMMIALNHISSFTKRGNSVNTGLNYNNIKMAGGINTQYGVTAGYTQSFFKEALSGTANINVNKSYIDKVSDGSIINGTLSLGYTFAKKHSLSFSFNIISTRSKQYEDYVETIGSLGYNLLLK